MGLDRIELKGITQPRRRDMTPPRRHCTSNCVSLTAPDEIAVGGGGMCVACPRLALVDANIAPCSPHLSLVLDRT